MVDSAIKYFFSADGSDKRGVQFAQALSVGRLSELVQVKNFLADPRVKALGMYDNDVHPEVVQFLVSVGDFHNMLFSKTAASLSLMTSTPTHAGHNFVKNIVEKFSLLRPDEKTFIDDYVNVVRRDPISSNPLEEKRIDELIPSDDLNVWTVNLRKADSGSPLIVRFAKKIHEVNINITQNSCDGIAPTGVQPLPTTLAMAYVGGFLGEYQINPAKLYGNPRLGFTVDMIAFIKSALASVKAAPDDGADLPASSILDFTTGDIISVKDGRFVKKEGSMSVPIDLTRDNCYTTQFKGPAADCQKLISDLIFSEDADAFNKYFSAFNDSYFAVTARDEIAKVHPDMAVKILKKFGFAVLNVPSGGRTLQKFESLYSWMQKLGDMKLSPDTLAGIRKATHLKTYLELLVHYVNNNPVILNSGVSAVDQRLEPEEVDPQSYLGRTRIVMLPRIPLGTAVGDKHDALLKIATTASMAHRLLALPASLPFPFPVMRLPGMVGGSVGGSATLRPIIRGLIADLGRKGKKLRASDQEAIEGHLNMLDKLEKSLVKVSQQLSEYKDWVSIFPGQQQTVSLGSIEGSIDKYRECVAQHANLELGIINVALKLCEK